LKKKIGNTYIDRMGKIRGFNLKEPHRRYPYFDVVVGLARSYEPESYAGVSLATGRVSHARQVKGDGPDKKRDTLVLQFGGR
jgi:hypothetical protein